MKKNNMQLFILPYAGGSTFTFRKLAERINKDVDVIPVEYPGRGLRAKETLSTKSFESFFNDIVKYIYQYRIADIPFCLMGYSMGSILAYELLIQKKISGKIKHLFISAEIPPKDRALELQKLGPPTEDLILERVRGLGGLNERMMKDQRFKDIYIKPMLSDYRLLFDYSFCDYQRKIEVNTTFFYCEKDTPLSDIKKWSNLLDGTFDFHEFGNNHFFINQHYKEIAKVINYHLSRYL